MLLEICAFNIQSCFVAQDAGASRIELCADQAQGGTTPSYGWLQYVREHITIPVFPMVRPRGGGFVYDEHELAIMRKDIIAIKQLGFPGIAIGIQRSNEEIDIEEMKRMVSLAYPMQVTCHKTFDKTPDAAASLEALINAGCARVLTSGLQKTATEGAAVLYALQQQAAGRIIIMPGGGVRSGNIGLLAKETGCMEFHSSALVAKGDNDIADKEEIKKLLANIHQ